MTEGIDSQGGRSHPGSGRDEATLAVGRRRKSRAPGRADPPSDKPKLPTVGDEIFGFRLCQELGRGAYACAFRAEQAELAGRSVVLKVSDLEGDEPQTLAQLQHTHIVPIYSVHEDAGLGLRAVCMPYFGGASLAHVLQLLFAETSQPTRGGQLVRALKSVKNPAPQAKPLASGAGDGAPPPDTPSPNSCPDASPTTLDTLGQLSYVRTAAWIVARLAEALQHAHQRGVTHRDIKPSNILLSADGEPMLLDFNVAQTLRNRQAIAVLGGTVAYMAPEHLRALSSRDAAQARQVDHRADIYSLGMVLYEVLAGCRPFAQTGSYSPMMPVLVAMSLERSQVHPSLRAKRPDVPWGLESIIQKCLAPDAGERYQQAEHLAEDLRRFLNDLPLKYAPELSTKERVQKWLRRHPRLASSGSVATAAALLLLGLTAGLVGVREHLARARNELAVVQAQDRKRAFEAGTLRARCLVNTTTDVQDYLPQGLAACENALSLYGVLDFDNWQEAPDWRLLDPDDQQRLAEDVRELLLLLAWARTRTDPGNPAVLRDALALLDRAQAVTGLPASRAIGEDRAAYLARLGHADEAEAVRQTVRQVQPASARDHYLLATTYAHGGRYAEAVAELDQALRLNPRHYWALVQRGICHQEMSKYTLAVSDFSAGIGLWPEFAWGWFNRGYVLEKSGCRPEAIADYNDALKRDPGLIPAYLNRGLAYLEQQQYPAALADFQKAAELGRDDATVHVGLGVALEGLKRHAEADAAFEQGFARAASAAPKVRLRLHWVYGFAVAARLPARAGQAFDEVLCEEPQNHQALYGRAMLLVDEGREREALAFLTRAVESGPGFVEARRYRAVLFARSGQFQAATEDVNWCLAKEPDSGANFYAAACVAARAAAKSADPATANQIADQAVYFLKKAFARGYGRDKAAGDPDLKGIERHPPFQQLLGEEK